MSTTAETGNAAATAAIYEAFGRGDVPSILDAIADDVRWEHWGDTRSREEVPWLAPGRGREHVARFFGLVGSFEIHRFEVLDVIGDGRQVAVEVLIEASLPDGGRFCDEELHLWSFDDEGKVIRMRHYVDTAKHRAAAAGEDTTG